MAKNRKGGTPPVEHQFKPGQSGNPGGRPKGRPSLRDTFLERLERKVWVNVDGERRQVPLREALFDKHLTAANPEVFLLFIKWAEGASPPPAATALAEHDAPEENAAIIAAAFEREFQRRAAEVNRDE